LSFPKPGEFRVTRNTVFVSGTAWRLRYSKRRLFHARIMGLRIVRRGGRYFAVAVRDREPRPVAWPPG
jgi:hypothetical protein